MFCINLRFPSSHFLLLLHLLLSFPIKIILRITYHHYRCGYSPRHRATSQVAGVAALLNSAVIEAGSELGTAPWRAKLEACDNMWR